MSLFMGRPLANFPRYLRNSPLYAFYLLKCVVIFKRPVTFIFNFLALRALSRVELRNGVRIQLSSDPHDVATVFMIWVRREYGEVIRGTTVVDIGANIGVFSLYCAYHGARKVLAYEPNSRSLQALEQNVRDNGYEDIIIPHHAAVSDVAGRVEKFPIQSSVYNKALELSSNQPHELVATTNLNQILASSGPISLLKMDCEGAEYAIVQGAAPETWSLIENIRLEYHYGKVDELTVVFERHNFRKAFQRRDHERIGNIWFARAI